MSEQYNQLLDLLKEREGHAEWVEQLDEDEHKALLKRKLVLGLMSPKAPLPEFSTNDEVRENIQKKVTATEEQAKRIADQVARTTT
jgi:flagellar biosynthesis/type III secretory pathway chaperone